MLEGANIKISGTITDINGKSARNILEHILSGKQIDSAEYDVLYKQKVIAHNLKATKEQIIDDMSELQKKMMRVLLNHLDELNIHIKELDDDINNFMKPDQKQAVAVIQDIPGIGNTSAQAIISVIGTDMKRFPTDAHIASWTGLCPGSNESAHRGRKRAYVAVAHSMLTAIYHMLKDSVVFKDLGAEYYTHFNKERKINAYLKKLKALGWEADAVAV